MKKLFTLLLSGVLAFSLVGCNSTAKPEEEKKEEETKEEAKEETKEEETKEEETASTEKTVVTIWHSYTDAQEEYLNKAATDFNASQDAYELKVESQPKDGLQDKIYQAVMAGNGPDLYFDYASTAARYVEDGKVVDLEKYLSAETVAKLPEGAKVEATSFTDGKLHQLPMVSSGPVAFYNNDIMTELGLEAPKTWDELLDVCRKILEAHPELDGAFALDSTTDVANCLIFQTGNKQYDPTTKEVLFNTPEVAAQFQKIADAYAEGLFIDVSGLNDGYCSSAYNNGQIAGFIGSVAGLPYIKGAPLMYGIVPQGGSTEWAPAWNRGMMIFDYGDENRIKAAAAFTDYFADPEVNAGWCVAVNYPALFADTMETETYKSFVANNEIFKYLNVAAAGAPSATDNNIIRSAMQNLMAALQGGTPVQDALDAAVEEIEDELAAQ